MGYESRLYIIRETNASGGEDGKFKYAETMAIYEMCVFPPFQKLFDKNECPATKYAPVYRDSVIVADMYDDLLRERSIDEVLECLSRVIAENGDDAHYPRIAPLKAMLEEFRKIQSEWYKLAVLHYGR